MFKITLNYLDKLSMRHTIKKQAETIEKQRRVILELKGTLAELEEFIGEEIEEGKDFLSMVDLPLRDPGGIR